MKMKYNIDTVRKYLPIALLLGFVLFKIQDLFLPYFWDEAWSYIPAIKEMAIKGSSLLPNSISPELYRGHPLLFYFLSSFWIKLLGSNIWIAKLFPLFISICFLQSVFSFAKKNFNYLTAILTLVILIIQSVFFAQSTFLLPEVLLALFTVLSLNSYIDKKYTSTIIWLTLALYTKESAVVIWGVIAFVRFLEVLNTKDVSLYYKFKKIIFFLFPLVFVLIFFLVQKFLVGWFFFPEHISYLSLAEFAGKLKGYSSYLFIFMGRNLLTLFGFGALIWLIIRKEHQLKEKRRILFILTFFIGTYLLFSSFNFYSPRYLVSILPFVILIWVYLIERVTRKYPILVTILSFAVIIANNLSFTINKRGGNDHTLGYRDLIKVQSEMVSYCEELEIYDDAIFTHFLMQYYLTNSDLGYLTNAIEFRNVNNKLTAKTEYAIISSNELDNGVYEKIKNRHKLLKRYEQKGSWIELYKVEHP